MQPLVGGPRSRLSSLLLILFCLFSSSYQQCSPSETPKIDSFRNNKANATNVFKIGVVGNQYGQVAAYTPSSILYFCTDRINNGEWDPDLLPDTRIELNFIASGTDTSGAFALENTLYAIKTLNVSGIIGGISTSEARVIQLVAKTYNVSQISAHAAGAVLSNKVDYPYFLRTQPSDVIQIPTIAAILDQFNWKRAVILYSNNDYGAGYTALVLQAPGVAFAPFPVPESASGTQEAMVSIAKEIKDKDYRIIVLYLTAAAVANVMHEANALGLIGDKFVYILSGQSVGAYSQSTLIPDPRPYLGGSIGVTNAFPAGPIYEREHELYRTSKSLAPGRYIMPAIAGFDYFYIMYDTVLTFAYAVDALIKAGVPFNEIKGQRLLNQMLITTYNGTTGTVFFDKNGDRLGAASVVNFNGSAQFEVAQYSLATSKLVQTREIGFFGGNTTVPVDGPPSPPNVSPDGLICSFYPNGTIVSCEQIYTLAKYDAGLAGGLGALVGMGALVSIFAAVMLAVFWDSFTKKYGMFYSAVVIFGVMLSMVAALTLLPKRTNELCLVFPWLIGIAFVLVYGCLFIKTWILYRLWRHAMNLKRMSITAMTVVKYVGAALTIEIIFLIVWSIVDPPEVKMIKMVNHTLEPQCHSKTRTFWIVFLSVKGAWLLFGAAIAVLTRSIVKEFNNFSAIVYAVYNNVILTVIAIPLAVLLEEVPHGVTIIATIVIVLAFTFTTIILFYENWQKVLCPNSTFPMMDVIMKRQNNQSSTSQNSPSHSGSSQSPSRSSAASSSSYL